MRPAVNSSVILRAEMKNAMSLTVPHEFRALARTRTCGSLRRCYNRCITMATEVKIRKIGNSLGLLLPKEAALDLDVEEGASLFLCKAPEGRFYLTAYDPEFKKQMEIAKKWMSKYSKTLREL